jgi:hypothetical protein
LRGVNYYYLLPGTRSCEPESEKNESKY